MTDWLIDKSALWKLPQSPDYEVWLERINRGKVWAGQPVQPVSRSWAAAPPAGAFCWRHG